MKDLAKELNVIQYLAPQATITATTTSDEVNLGGIKGHALITLSLGALAAISAANKFTMTVTQSTETGGTFTAAASNQYNWGDDWEGVVDDNATAGDVYKLNFKPKTGYPFIKVVLTEAGTASAFMSGLVEFEDRYNPV